MGDFEEKLNAILSNPDALAQVANLAQSLNLGGSAAQDGAPSQDPAAADSAEPSGGAPDLGALSGLGELFGQIDPNMLKKFLPLLNEFTGGSSDERLQLLYALRPFLRPERRDKIERAVKTAKLIHVGKKFLKTMGEPYV